MLTPVFLSHSSPSFEGVAAEDRKFKLRGQFCNRLLPCVRILHKP